VRLVGPDGRETGAARVDEPVRLRTFFRTKRPGLEVRCVFAVESGSVVAFRTPQPRMFRADEPGLYSGTVEVPPHLLNDRSYTVKAGLMLEHDGASSSLARRNALHFRVYDADEDVSARGDYGETLDGLVRPRLDWTVRPEEAMPEAAAPERARPKREQEEREHADRADDERFDDPDEDDEILGR
jgi:hypothetical protein